MKKKIIVPIDFSAASQNAYLYARELAKKYQSAIEVVHIHLGSLSTTNVPELQVDENAESKLRKNLETFASIYPQSDQEDIITKIDVSTRLIMGVTVRSIVELSAEPSTQMIVMGCTGESDVVDKLVGRISSDVAQKAFCPVLLVPKGAKYFNFKNILYASNYESADENMINEVLKFNEIFKATLHFVQVNSNGESETIEMTEDQIFEKLFKDGDPSFSFNLATIKSESVIKGLFQYSLENNIDLIVLVNRQRGFFESAFGQSLTRNMALETHTPLLTYHLQE